MDDPDAVDALLVDARAVLAQRPQSDAVADNVQPLDALARTDQGRAELDAAFHNAHGEVGVWEGVPVVFLVGAAEDCASSCVVVISYVRWFFGCMALRTRRSRHHVGHFVIAIIGPGDGAHQPGVVADDDNLAAGWQEGGVLYAAQRAGRQPRAVDDEVGPLARMVRVGRLGDVLDDGALEDDAVLAALAHQPGEVHGGVDADGGEAVGVVDAGGKFVWEEFTEL